MCFMALLISHFNMKCAILKPSGIAQSVGHLTCKSGVLGSIPGLFLLPLFQEGQLSVTGESMCTKYWLTA